MNSGKNPEFDMHTSACTTDIKISFSKSHRNYENMAVGEKGTLVGYSNDGNGFLDYYTTMCIQTQYVFNSACKAFEKELLFN